MKINKRQIAVVAAVVVVAGAGWMWLIRKPASEGPAKIIHAHIGQIQAMVSTTGTVLPKNRLEIKPPVNGRIEQVLIQEGQNVKTGDIMAWMSSTDRAALLDAARGQGEEKLKYWQEVYKPIPLLAPIDGEVIVGTVQPGQTVTTADAVVVLSDRLIVRAQVDETDIGNIQQGQKAMVNLDAYPDTRINAVVDHIYYESKTVNNVTTYEVDLLPESVPPFFRSGMNANIDFIQEGKKDVLVLPLSVVRKDQDGSFVMVSPGQGEKPVRRTLTLGISDDKNVEIVSGLTQDDEIVSKTKQYKLPQSAVSGSSPLTPARRGR